MKMDNNVTDVVKYIVGVGILIFIGMFIWCDINGNLVELPPIFIKGLLEDCSTHMSTKEKDAK